MPLSPFQAALFMALDYHDALPTDAVDTEVLFGTADLFRLRQALARVAEQGLIVMDTQGRWCMTEKGKAIYRQYLQQSS